MKQQREESLPELPHVVRDALDALKPVPDADPAVWQRNRNAYLAAIRLESAADRSVPEAQLALSSPDLGVLGWRRVFAELFRFRSRGLQPLTIALRLAMVVALLLGSGVGTVAAAKQSLPGSALYPLKVQLEQWEMARVDGPLELSARALDHSQARLWEANRLSQKGRAVPEDVATRYEQQLTTALQASGTLTEPLRLQAQSRISETVQHHVRTMAQISAKVGEGQGDPTIQAMIRTMEETQARLGTGTGPDDAGNGPEQAGPAAGDQVQNGPGETNNEGEPFGPSDGDTEAPGSGPGYGQPDNDDGSGSVNGPDKGNGQNNGSPKTNTGSNDNGGGSGNR